MKHNYFSVFKFFVFLLWSTLSFGQKNNDLQFVLKPTYGNKILKANTWYVSKNNDSILFTKIRFYLTEFKIITKTNEIHLIKNSNYLIDVFDENTHKISFQDIKREDITAVSFNIGVVESMNTAGALSGDLDPSKGMYWSWQSGYINLKIEGISPSCNTRKQKFQFHIGGYKVPFKTTQRIHFDLEQSKKDPIILIIDLSKFFSDIKLAEKNQIMIPGKEAKLIADKTPKLFSIYE